MRRVIALLPLVLAVAAGCGGDDDDSGALSKQEYIAQGNQICAEGNAERGQAAESLGPNPDQAALEAFVRDTFVPSVQGDLDDLREGIPEGDEDQVNGILDDAEAVLDDLGQDPSLAVGNPFVEVNEQFTEYGLSICAGTPL